MLLLSFLLLQIQVRRLHLLLQQTQLLRMHSLLLLRLLWYGQQVDFNDIHTEGITKISATDIKYAKAIKCFM